MPETPDFERIARTMITPIDGDDDERRQAIAGVVAEIAEQLRLMWNARGAADRATLEAQAPEAYTKTFDRALRTLDR